MCSRDYICVCRMGCLHLMHCVFLRMQIIWAMMIKDDIDFFTTIPDLTNHIIIPDFFITGYSFLVLLSSSFFWRFWIYIVYSSRLLLYFVQCYSLYVHPPILFGKNKVLPSSSFLTGSVPIQFSTERGEWWKWAGNKGR